VNRVRLANILKRLHPDKHGSNRYAAIVRLAIALYQRDRRERICQCGQGKARVSKRCRMCALKLRHRGRLKLAASAAAALLLLSGCTSQSESISRRPQHSFRPMLPVEVSSAPAVFPEAPATANLTLAWDAAPDDTVVGYRAHYGGSSRAYTNTTQAGSSLTCYLTGFTVGGTYYFAVTSYNATNAESVYSDELIYMVTSPKLEIILLGAGSPGGPWLPVSTNIVVPSEPARFFMQNIKWH
jgi:hypothetical protein